MKQTFESHLNRRDFSLQTIQKMKSTVKKYRLWLEQNNSTVYLADHKTAIQYIDYLRSELRYKPITINLRLAQLRHYYNFLSTTKNPFYNLKVRGEKKRVNIGWLNDDELLEMYISLPQNNVLEVRVKILAGFYIFQGISTRDLIHIRFKDISLDEGLITIPQTRRGNMRVLTINPVQKLLLKKVQDNPPCHLVYQSLSKGKQARWVVKHLHLNLQKMNNYKSLAQIRYSVIQNWLKRNNLRRVQYNAGHRYITTTEKMLENDYESLKLAILTNHPLDI